MAKTSYKLYQDFYGRIKSLPDLVTNVRAQTAGQARAAILKRAREAGYDVDFVDVEVRRGQWVHGVDAWLSRVST